MAAKPSPRTWLGRKPSWWPVDAAIVALSVFLFLQFIWPWLHRPRPLDLEALRAAAPSTNIGWQAALDDSIVAAADYLVAYQLSNGEMPYALHVTGGSENQQTVYIRQIAGAGSLYTACRVAGDESYCAAADRGLALYLTHLVAPRAAPGLCFEEHGWCWLGASSIAIDTIYKRWQATGSTLLDGEDLLPIAQAQGEFLASMRRDNGDLIFAYDPYLGRPILQSSDPYASGESLMALLELAEMTGDSVWLEEARQTNAFKLRDPVEADHWQAYAYYFFARLDDLGEEDVARAREIGQEALARQDSLTAEVSAVSGASNVEALAALALAFAELGEEHAWLRPGLETFSQFVMSHQLPAHTCDWAGSLDLSPVAGGIYATCEEPVIRVDGNQHWINGAAHFLEYLERSG